MKIADYIQDSIVDGPGLRFTLFTQGCPHRCRGCHNPNTHDPEGGTEIEVQEIIKKLKGNPLTDGITFSGGEPFSQARDCAIIAKEAKDAGLNVWCYTGYRIEELLAQNDSDIMSFLEKIDVLIDGRFILEQRSLSLKWRGSENQRILNVKETLAEGGEPSYYEG